MKLKIQSSVVISLIFILFFSSTISGSAQAISLKQNIQGGEPFWQPVVVKDSNSVAQINFNSSSTQINFILVNSSNYNVNPSAIKNPLFRVNNVSFLNQEFQLTSSGTYYFGFQNINLFNSTVVTFQITITAPAFDVVNFLINLVPYVFIIVVIGLVANYGYEYYSSKRKLNSNNKQEANEVNSDSLNESDYESK